MKLHDWWRLSAFREAGRTLEWCSKRLKLSVRCLSDNLRKGAPDKRRRAARKPAAVVAKKLSARRRLVRKLLKKQVKMVEKVSVTYNKDGSVRKNSKQPRVQIRFPTGSLNRCRRALFREHGMEVSRSTIHRDRQHLGLCCKKRPNGPQRFLQDASKRLEYAEQKLPFARKFKKRVRFVDEKIFDSLDSDRYAYVEDDEPAPARERERFGPRVHAFAMIGFGFKFLHMFGENEKVNAEVYRRDCIEPNLQELRKKWLLQDGAGCHEAIVEWLKENGVSIVEHPARSPDCNPVEKLWAILARKVSAYGPLTHAELRRYIRAEFDAIPQSTINSLCCHWPDMLEAVISAKGETSRI